MIQEPTRNQSAQHSTRHEQQAPDETTLITQNNHPPKRHETKRNGTKQNKTKRTLQDSRTDPPFTPELARLRPTLTCKNGCLSMSCAVIRSSVSNLKQPLKNDKKWSDSCSSEARFGGKNTDIGSRLEDRGTDRKVSEPDRLRALS